MDLLQDVFYFYSNLDELFDQINRVIFTEFQLFLLYTYEKSILITKGTTISILISINPIAIWGGGNPLKNGKN